MKEPILPPVNFRLSLPALTADEAEQILNLVDTLHQLLHEAYDQAVNENCAATYVTDGIDADDDLDF